MTLKLLKRALHLDADEDSKLDQEVKAKRAKKKSVVVQERERLKDEQSQYDFDFERFELKKKEKSNISVPEKANQVAKIFNKKKAESGVSLVDQYRDNLKQDNEPNDEADEELEAEYKQLTDKSKLKERQLLQAIKCRGSVVRQRRAARQDVRAVFFKKPPTKKESNSVFSEVDFRTNARGNYSAK